MLLHDKNSCGQVTQDFRLINILDVSSLNEYKVEYILGGEKFHFGKHSTFYKTIVHSKTYSIYNNLYCTYF